MFTRIAILILFSLIVDLINHYGLKKLFRRFEGSYFYKFIFFSYWLSGLILVAIFIFHYITTGNPDDNFRDYRSFFTIFGAYILIYFPRISFILFVIIQGIYYFFKDISRRKKKDVIRHYKRKAYGLQKIGLLVSLLIFSITLYGIIFGRTHYKVVEEEIYFKNLPESFDGFKILHISDLHLGSFYKVKNAFKGFNIAGNQNYDILICSGDMVNNVAKEMEPYIPHLKKLKPIYGMFSVLGNHDMGDYVKWGDKDRKLSNLQSLIKNEEKAGFKVLTNHSEYIKINNDSIAIIGVSNWGNPPFKRYGDLNLALKGISDDDFKILISHDPSHFIEQILSKTNIDLTLSGHTHGMQLGINTKYFKASPAKWIYNEWLGLYKFGEQYLYVNPGFGFLGMPARVGIRPEITILTLKKSNE